MFLSQFQHSLDDKGRVILPAKWRSALEGGAFVTEYPSGCLAVFTPDEFAIVADRVRARAARGVNERFVATSFFSGATDVSPDKQGRIALPQNLRDFASLHGDVMLVGQYDHAEIWNPETFATKKGVGTKVLHSDEGIEIFNMFTGS